MGDFPQFIDSTQNGRRIFSSENLIFPSKNVHPLKVGSQVTSSSGGRTETLDYRGYWTHCFVRMTTAERSWRNKHLQEVSHGLPGILLLRFCNCLSLDRIRFHSFRRTIPVRGAAQEMLGQQRSRGLEPARRTSVERHRRCRDRLGRRAWYNWCDGCLALSFPSRSRNDDSVPSLLLG